GWGWEEVGEARGGARGVVERAGVVGVGGADVGEVPPRHDEHRPPVFGDRDDHGDVVADLAPRHGDVHALAGPDRVRMRRLVEGAYVVGPDAGRVDDDVGAHVDLVAVGLHARPAHAPVAVLA